MAPKMQFSFMRYEKKYLLSTDQYARLCTSLKEYMKPDEYGKYTICNIYCDTDDWRLIRASIEKPVYKEKLRIRSYGVPDNNGTVFLELKKKFDGVVYKRRAKMGLSDIDTYFKRGICPVGNGQIYSEIDWFMKYYQPKPKVFIAYDRIALAGTKSSDLRITFDTNIRCRTHDLDLRLGDHGAPLISDDLVLMEIKIPGAAPIWLSHILSSLNIFPTSFSKYGTCYTNNLVAQNKNDSKGAVNCA